MRRLLAVLGAVMLAGSLASSGVAAEPLGQPDMFVGASGDWTYVPVPAGFTIRTAGNTTFIEGTEVSTFTGTFEGTSSDAFVVVCHQKGSEAVTNFVKGTIAFTGTVDGRAGELTMGFRGKQESTTCDPSGAIWSGTWVVIGGSGDLTDLHGHGTWTGPSFDLDYTGQIHFR